MFRIMLVLGLLALAWVWILFVPPMGCATDLKGGEATLEVVSPPNLEADETGSTWEILTHRVREHPFNLVPLIIFGMSLVHAFSAGWFRLLGESIHHRLLKKQKARGGPTDSEHTFSFAAEICYFLGEVEVVFALWIIPLIVAISYRYDWQVALSYLKSRNYTDPFFEVVMMTIASSQPILHLAEQALKWIARLGGQTPGAWWLSLMIVGPLLGSLITEPAAITITALLLSKKFFLYHPNRRFAYASLGLLFTNISLGGVLTNFASPAVLIVSREWEWTTPYMFMQFGWKAVLTVVISTVVYYLFFRKDLLRLKASQIARTWSGESHHQHTPRWLIVAHVMFLVWLIIASHELIVFVGTFLIFFAFYQATRPLQRPLNLRPPLLVGLFLAGLVIHGGLQGWWIEPLLTSLASFPLLLLSLVLSTFNDNAAITYLSSLPHSFSELQKYVVMVGAITAGGLTVIANSPNPAGAQLLRKDFKGGISHFGLLLGALIPTIVGLAVFTLFGLLIQ